MDRFTLGEATVHRVEELRTRLPMDMFGADGALIIPAHFAAPHIGRLRQTGAVHSFVPESDHT